MDQRFSGKTVIVTGGSANIGLGCARRFSAEGANVVLAARNKEKLDAVAAGFDASRTLTVATDVSDHEEIDALIAATVKRFGQIDVLVSNAGMAILKSFEETSLDDWHRTMAVDLDGCFLGAKAALPYLKQSKGSIVHVASASGLGGDINLVAYNAAKGAVVNFTRGLATELGRFGIRVNAIAPSLTLPLGSPEAVQYEALIGLFNQRMALDGPGTPEDIAAAAAFLASPDARFITGIILPVDGGLTASSGQPTMG